ncbi:MAG: 16S rRNA (cytosine(967)-C(5))-methyltransferase RsmB [Pseudomonadota bacterium]
MSKTSQQTPRLIAVYILRDIITQNASLSQLDAQSHSLSAQDKSFVQAVCYGACRYFEVLDGCIDQLMKKPLKEKDADIFAVLISAAYQLLYMRVPAYAAINTAVETTRALKKKWACKMVNGVLRNLERQHETLMKQLNPAQTVSHPQWLFDRIHADWPEHADAILDANNLQAPMYLRVSPTVPREDYLTRLTDALPVNAYRDGDDSAEQPAKTPETTSDSHQSCNFSIHGIRLAQPVNVLALPSFEEGLVSVQDEAAQLASLVLAPNDGDYVLDACAAPGGKSCHLLELADIELLALDIDPMRCDKIEENLERLQLQAAVQVADASDVEAWWDERLFDRILLDTPCSASGVIRRHPDIKLLRTTDDITALNEIQTQLLDALWPTLKQGGRILYATCSVFHSENEAQIDAFLSRHKDVKVIPIDADWGVQLAHGRQLLPSEGGPDGFYYALLEKH